MGDGFTPEEIKAIAALKRQMLSKSRRRAQIAKRIFADEELFRRFLTEWQEHKEAAAA